ncbi:MAG: hypothetical protein AAGA48_37290 [Myxococcota bacterium]
MPSSLPIAVRLTPAFASGRVRLADVLAHVAGPAARGHESRWRLSSREWTFARRVLTEATRLWLWRTDPGAFAGDFVLVDMSSAEPERRPAWVVDLKCGAPLKVGGGGAGNSLVQAARAMAWLEAQGIVGPGAPVLATGDGAVVFDLCTLRIPGPGSRGTPR